jgi:hypothetical protein
MPTSINDHEGLHDTMGRAALAGAAASIAGLFVLADLATALWVGVVAAAVTVPRSVGAIAKIALGACLAGAATHLPGIYGSLAPALLLGGAASLGSKGWGRLVALGAGFAAFLIKGGLHASGIAPWLPPGVSAMVMGGLSGGVAGWAVLGRHLLPAPAQVPAIGRPRIGGEIGELVGRAQAAQSEADRAIAQDAPEVAQAARDLVGRIERFAERWYEVEREAARSPRRAVEVRLVELDERIAATKDQVAQNEFTRARAALKAQLDYLDEIGRGRERAVARLSHQVAALERLRLQALRHRSVDASRLGAELQPVAEELAQAGVDLDIASDALLEAAVTPTEAPDAPACQTSDRLLS